MSEVETYASQYYQEAHADGTSGNFTDDVVWAYEAGFFKATELQQKRIAELEAENADLKHRLEIAVTALEFIRDNNQIDN